MTWLTKLARKLHRRKHSNGEVAAARTDAERKLREARRDWPAVHHAHDQLAEWVDTAFRGNR